MEADKRKAALTSLVIVGAAFIVGVCCGAGCFGLFNWAG